MQVKAGWWRRNREREREWFARWFGLELEIRVEGALALDRDGGLTDLTFPGARSARHFALLLLGELTEAARQRERDGAPSVTAGWTPVAASTARPAADRVFRTWRRGLRKAHQARWWTAGPRAERGAAREAPLKLALELARQPWSSEWVAGLRRTGVLTSRPDAEQVVRAAATVLGALPLPGEARHTLSRVELGARLLGDAHALDRDTLVHHVVLRGLAAAAGVPVPTSALERESLWAGVGVAPDLVSRTCLMLGLRLEGDGPLARRLADAAGAGDPVRLSAWDLRRAEGLRPVVDAPVLVCENPRVLEAVAERRVEGWVFVCTAGEQPRGGPEVLPRLLEAMGGRR